MAKYPKSDKEVGLSTKTALTAYRARLIKRMGFDPVDIEAWSRKWRHLCGNGTRRGNPVELTFYQYMVLAREAELTSPDQIGNKPGLYQMGRLGDEGPYKVGNCRFITHEQNLQEQLENTGGDTALYERIKNWRESASEEELQAVQVKRSEAIRTSEKFKEGRKIFAEKMRGRTHLNNEGRRITREKLMGRTYDTHEGMKRSGDAQARPFRLVSPEGTVYTEGRLKQICIDNGLRLSHVRSMLRGNRKSSVNGWTGEYTGPRRCHIKEESND